MVAREIERLGIPTVTLAALRRAIQLVRPPRALFTGYRNDEIVGPPEDAQAQRATLQRALALLAEASEPGALVEAPRSGQ